MNKLISKIVGVALGLSLATGIGAGVVLGNQNISKADAAETLDYTLDGTSTGGSSGYDTASSITQGSVTWDVYANTTMNPWRIGGKSLSSVDRLVKSTGVVSTGNITKVELTVGTASSVTVNSLKLLVGTAAGGSQTSTVTQTFAASSTITFNRPSGADWTGKYFTFDFNITITQTSNKFLQFISAKFYREIQDQTITGISVDDVTVYTGQTVTPEVTAEPQGATLPSDLSYSLTNVSPAGCVTVNSSTGALTGVAAGSATLTVTSAGNNTLTDTATVTVSAYPLSGISVGKSYALAAVGYDFELSSMASGYGAVSSYTTTPSCNYPVDVENGSRTGTVAFSFGGAYLAWTSGNSLTTESSVSDSSSWVVTYENDEYTVINLSTFHNATGKRYLRFNNGADPKRFACYESGQVAVNFYEITGAALTDFTIDASINVYKTGTATIGVIYTPADAVDKTLTWASDDTSIATVDQTGVVTGVAVGTCNVTASKVIGGVTVTRTCEVTVLNNKASHLGTSADPFDVSDAVNAAKGIIVETSNGTAIDLANTYYYVQGIITKAETRTTSTLTFWIGDNNSQVSAATGALEIYKVAKVYGTNLADAYSENSEVARDFGLGYTVKASGKLVYYNSVTPEMNAGGLVYYNSYIEARTFATAFNTALEAVCDADGNTAAADLASAWSTQGTAFGALASDAQVILTEAAAKTTSSATAVELCAAKYDYILGKYGTSTLSNFMNRTVAASSANTGVRTFATNNNGALIVVVVAAFVSATFIGGYFFLRKKKEN